VARDDIIRMAREAGYIELAKEAGWEYADDDRGFEPLWHFAALVAAAEREACAKLCEEPGWNAANWCATQIRARGKA
jgi:hypothetical protein